MQCSECQKTFPKQNNLLKHRRNVHNIYCVSKERRKDCTTDTYNCQYCEKEYTSASSRWIHEKKCKIKCIEEEERRNNAKIMEEEEKRNNAKILEEEEEKRNNAKIMEEEEKRNNAKILEEEENKQHNSEKIKSIIKTLLNML